jgi:hypothetical protein
MPIDSTAGSYNAMSLSRSTVTGVPGVRRKRVVVPIELVLLALLTSASLGCGGKTVQAPEIDPQDAAAKALELYDTDGDSLLSEQELKACPGLLSAMNRYDTDGDRNISADEISTKLEGLLSSGVEMVSVRCFVHYKGRPLRGAQVRYVPEAFLGDSLLAAEGTTDSSGLAEPMIADELLPEDYRGLQSMQPGVYRIEITHPEAKLPARYSGQESPLGHEVDPSARGGDDVQLKLSSK